MTCDQCALSLGVVQIIMDVISKYNSKYWRKRFTYNNSLIIYQGKVFEESELYPTNYSTSEEIW